MQIEWSEGEVLKWAGVGTEVEKVACEGVAARMDGRRWYERGSGVRMGSGARRTGAERGEPCRVFELWANTSCRRSHQQRGRTELDLSSGQAFDNCHGPTCCSRCPWGVVAPRLEAPSPGSPSIAWRRRASNNTPAHEARTPGRHLDADPASYLPFEKRKALVALPGVGTSCKLARSHAFPRNPRQYSCPALLPKIPARDLPLPMG